MKNRTGLEYLQAEIACKHDKSFEKKTWNERLAHFKTIDLDNPRIFKIASDPIGLRAAILAHNQTELGLASGYMISLDACSSGLQILSLLVSCPKSFDLCGGRSDACVDSYTAIYGAMNLHGVLTRKQVKNAIMTSLYGSVATPESTFGEHIDLFYETIEAMAPGAWDLNLGLQQLWDDVSGSTYTWAMPDNFHACIETKDKDEIPFKFLEEDYKLSVNVDSRPDFHKGLGPNLIHSIDGMIVREMLRRCMMDVQTKQRFVKVYNSSNQTSDGKSAEMVQTLWDHYDATGFLSVRIFDYIYEDTAGLVDMNTLNELFWTLPNKSFDVVTVHDCFRCHPNYGNDLRRQYNTILADINDSIMLEDIAKQVAHQGIKTNKVGKIDRDTILDGEYLLA